MGCNNKNKLDLTIKNIHMWSIAKHKKTDIKLFLWKEEEEKKNPSARFSLCIPRGPAPEEKQHVQEVRRHVRKAFSGSIRQAGEGKDGRLRQSGRGRKTPRTQGSGKASGERPVRFSRVLLRISLSLGKNIQLSSFPSPSELSTQRLGGVRRGKWGTSGSCHLWLPEATAIFTVWS